MPNFIHDYFSLQAIQNQLGLNETETDVQVMQELIARTYTLDNFDTMDILDYSIYQEQ